MYSPIFVWIGFILLGSIIISQCSATEEETKGCLNDKYIVSVFNVNDKSTVTVNGRLVTTQKFLENSGPIDVSKDMIVGKNTFTFKTFNGPAHYAWGFQLKKNGATVFYTKEGEAEGGGKGARNNDLTRLNQIVYDKTITIDISDCSPKPLTPIKGCLEDKYTVTVFNTDDKSTVDVNGRIIITKNFLDNAETIDVSKNMISGTNKLIFKTYNGGTRYAWGFELKKNGERVFYSKEGDAVGHNGGANNNDVTRENQVVYDKTVIIETTECSPKPSAPIKGCLEDKYTVTVFNADDTSTVNVNGRIIITKNFLDNPETIDVSKNMISGTNKLIFKTYNGGTRYAWGFELKKNGERVFYAKEGDAAGHDGGANNNDVTRENQVVYDKTVIIETTECSPKPPAPIKGCLEDKYTVTVFNTDDKSTVDVNGRIVITKNFLDNAETIDVSKNMISGTNKLIFKTYNGGGRYAWGFELMKNGERVFYSKNEVESVGHESGANNNGLTGAIQVVYDKTVIIETTECSPKPPAPVKGCLNDKYVVTVFNVNDKSTVDVNGRIVITKNYLENSDPVDVSKDMVVGSNKLTFKTYNGPSHYAWGFELKKNGERVFYTKEGEAEGQGNGARNNDLTRENQLVYDKTFTIDVTECSPKPSTPIKGCLDDKYTVTVFNTDDKSTVDVNGRLVITKHYLENSETIDVSKDMVSGTNKLTFKTYNGQNRYAWGFDLKRNGITVFYTKEGDAEGEGNGARDNDLARLNQVVYDKTVIIDTSECCPKISTNKPTMLTSFKCGAQNYCIRKCFPESNTNDMGRPTGVSTCYAYNTKSGYTCERDSDCTSTAKCIAPCRANTILL